MLVICTPGYRDCGLTQKNKKTKKGPGNGKRKIRLEQEKWSQELGQQQTTEKQKIVSGNGTETKMMKKEK